MNAPWRYPFNWPRVSETLTLFPECCPVIVDTIIGEQVRIIMPGGALFVVPTWSLVREPRLGIHRPPEGPRRLVRWCHVQHEHHLCGHQESDIRDRAVRHNAHQRERNHQRQTL